MKQFSDFGITITTKAFIGDKIKVTKILNRPIEVLDFKIDNSKFTESGSGKCLCLQIRYNDELHVVFTGSLPLMEQINQVPRDTGLPFTATIIKENERYKFT